MKEHKQVIVVRKDLGMSPGKTAAQVAHASLKAVIGKFDVDMVNKMLELSLASPLNQWLNGSQVKIIVSVDSEEELLDLYSKVQGSGLPKSIIKDEARTELNKPAYTVAAIGPGDPDIINLYTGHLPLL